MNFNFSKTIRAAVLSAAALACFATAMPAAQAAPIYNNLNATQDGSDALYPGPLANAFTTGASGGVLAGIQALLMSLSPDVTSDIQVNLLSDNSTHPGAWLASLGSLSSAAISTSGFEAYSFTPLSTFMLEANTTYWVEIMAPDANAVQWAWSLDNSALGVAGQSSYNAGFGVMANSDFGAYQMAVTVPEPGSLALVFLGLGLVVAVSRRRTR